VFFTEKREGWKAPRAPRFECTRVITIAAVFFAMVSPLLYAGPESSPYLYVNLQGPVYLKTGFDPGEAFHSPRQDDKTWRRIEWNGPLLIKDSGLPDLPERAFLSPFAGKELEFTTIIPFALDREAKNRISRTFDKTPGIFLSFLGDNWEIYLNGNLIRSEMYRDTEGRILSHRFERNIFFPVRQDLFTEGENILTIRIAGDPTDRITGFLYTDAYYIGEYHEIASAHQEFLFLVQIGAYLFMGAYYLALFLNRRNARHYLFFSLFSLALGIYFLTMTRVVYLLFPDTAYSACLEYIALFLTLPLVAAFVENAVINRTLLITKLYGGLFAFLGLIQIFFSQAFRSDILKLWQFCAIGAAGFLVVFDFGYLFLVTAQGVKKRLAGEGRRASPFRIALVTITGTVTGNLLVCGLVSLSIGLFDVIAKLFFHNSFILSRYGLFIFTGMGGIILSRQIGELVDELIRAKTALEQTNANLEETVRERTRELEKQTHRAEGASRTKSEFLAKISHEIRTPLNAIIGLVEIELRKKPLGETGENMEEIHSSGSTLLALINEMLDISRIESGRVELNPVEYDSLGLLGECIRVNMVRIGPKPVEFKADIDEALPKTLIGDELRVKQILNNLLSNGIKYTDKGSVTLRVRCRREGERCALVFIVEDTGRGIKEENLDTIFQEYRRADELLNRGIEGAGLGLPITKALAEIMEGRIEAASVYGEGSTFTVTVYQRVGNGDPVGKTAAEHAFDPAFRLKNRDEQAFIQLPKASVLVVDDVYTNLKVALGLFRPYGMNVVLAKSGEQAIKILKSPNITFNAIFMDHLMPEMDGIEAVRIIREEVGGYLKTIPIIALTANALIGSEQMFLENGFQDFLPKPVDAQRLDSIIKKWLVKQPLED
jgi:signal transduction histidine kinase/ActR/RegA family two-component response regulator